jgi:hypothetical protein
MLTQQILGNFQSKMANSLSEKKIREGLLLLKEGEKL